MANTTKKRKQPLKWQRDVQNQAGVKELSPPQLKERGGGVGGFKLDEAKIRAKGEV